MGNTESTTTTTTSDYDYEDEFAKFEGIDTLGYRVLGVQPNSPASQAGLVSFFDFLVGANGRILLASGEGLDEGQEYDDVDFPALCQEFLNEPLELLVWNIKCQEKRLVTITPSNSWGGAGLLGVTIRLDDYGGADERLIRVLNVEPSSPAAICGLVENHDYLLGTTTDSFDSISTLSLNVLRRHVDRVVEIYVYNTDSDVVRVVALMPTFSWGGSGLLGAELGTGYLHRLPSSSRNTTGSSVERKVRWVGMKPPKHPAEQEDDLSQQKETLEVEPQLEMEVVDSEAPHEDTHKTAQQVADHSSGGVRVHGQPSTTSRSGGQASRPRAKEIGNDFALHALKQPEMMATMSSEPSREAPREKEDFETRSSSWSSSAPVSAVVVEEAKVAQDDPVPKGTVPSASAQDDPVDDEERATPPAQATKKQSPPTPNAASFFARAPPADALTTATTSYASQFLPPPPMSRLERKDKEVNLR